MRAALAAVLLLAGSFAQELVPPTAGERSTAVTKGSVVGRVVDPDGKPFVHLPIVILRAELVDGASADAVAKGTGNGRTGRTSNDGSFVFEGVDPGSYHLCYTQGERTTRISTRAFEPGEAFEFVLPLHRLVVRCHDAEGKLVQPRSSTRPARSEDGFIPMPTCWPLVPGRQPRTPLAILSVDTEAVQFAVERDMSYAVSSLRMENGPVEELVTVRDHLTECVLRLAPHRPVGKLAVQVFGPDGRELRTGDYQLALCSLASRLPIARKGAREFDPPEFDTEIPAGVYLLRARNDEPAPDCGTGWTPRAPRWMPIEQDVRIVSGETTKVVLRAQVGGRLDLDLKLEPKLHERKLAEWARRFPTQTSPPSSAWIALGSKGPAAQVALTPLDGNGRAADAPIEIEMFNPELLRCYHDYGMLPGTRDHSYTLVPPGRYSLSIVAPEFEPFTSVVEMRPDGLTSVQVELVERAPPTPR